MIVAILIFYVAMSKYCDLKFYWWLYVSFPNARFPYNIIPNFPNPELAVILTFHYWQKVSGPVAPEGCIPGPRPRGLRIVVFGKLTSLGLYRSGLVHLGYRRSVFISEDFISHLVNYCFNEFQVWICQLVV